MCKLSSGHMPPRCASRSMLQADQLKLRGHVHEPACTAHASQAMQGVCRCAQCWQQASRDEKSWCVALRSMLRCVCV